MSAPRLSLLTVVDDEHVQLDALRASLASQRLVEWEWIVVAPAGARVPDDDDRVRRLAPPAGHEVPLQAALEAAVGDLVAVVRHDDVLKPAALAAVSRAAEGAAGDDGADVVYTDESDGEVELRKPAWSPERLRHVDFIGGLCAVRRDLAREVGGFRAGFRGAEEHDLLLRATEQTGRVVHVRRTLLRRAPRTAVAEEAWQSAVRAVDEHLGRMGIAGRASRGPRPGLVRVERIPAVDVPVSIVIPTIGSSGAVRGVERVMVVDTVRSVIERTTQREIEFVVVYDSPTPPDVVEELTKLDGTRAGVSVRMVEFPEPFNFSAKCNVGALHAEHDVLVFLNDDMEAVSDEVIGKLVAPLAEPGVGVTGAKLLFENGRIQHGGVQYGSGTVYPSFYKEPGDASGPQGDLWINRETTALTGACLGVTRETFRRVGGFNEALPMNFNDVDFCLKVRHIGLRALWLHDVVLHHFESISRSPEVRQWEFDAMTSRWGDRKVVRERYTTGVR